MTRIEDLFDVPHDDIDDDEEVIMKVLDAFDEKDLSVIGRLTVLTNLLAYTYVTMMRDEWDVEDFAHGVGEVLGVCIPILVTIGADHFRNGGKE